MRKALIIIAIILAFTAGSFATPQMQLIQAYLSPGITVLVDGKTKTFTDVNGNVVYPITYNGTTYLPVRAVGFAVGKEVNWDGILKTVYIGSKPNAVMYEFYNTVISDTMGLLKKLLDNLQIVYDKSKTTAERQVALNAFMDAYKGVEDQWKKVNDKTSSNISEQKVHDCVYDYVNSVLLYAEASRLYANDFINGKINTEAFANMNKYGGVLGEKGTIAIESLALLRSNNQ